MKNVGRVLLAVGLALAAAGTHADDIVVGPQQTLEGRGLSVLLHHNAFHPYFGDQKMSGLELVLHGRRIATDGEVRIVPTPQQWDPVPEFERREVDPAARRLTSFARYSKQGLAYRVDVAPEDGGGLRVAVHLTAPLPPALAGRAGFNLEFLPAAYFGKTYAMDGDAGVFPRHPRGPMRRQPDGAVEAVALATGRRLVLAPEDPLARVEIVSDSGPLLLLDGRNQAQNGWFVVRTLIPGGATENALVWHVRPHRIADWTRPPVVAHSQVGYHPRQPKVAVIELDPRFEAPRSARVLRLNAAGQYEEAFRGDTRPWGRWLRYDYAHFDFSDVREPGVYAIEYAGTRGAPFRIAENVYRDGVWQPSLDTYLPIQMDHVKVREGYRIWHGPSHLDDARQAPVNLTHFDGYAQGPTTDSPFAPGEHIPGLDRGGWYDAGDFDLRTGTQAAVITSLVLAIEAFGVDWDETTVDQPARSVEIRRPDGVPDAVQQVEHGVLALLGQYRSVGHAINGIVEPTLQQYTHLGDGASKTDGRVFAARLGPLQTDGLLTGLPDDRWAFTNRSTPLDYAAAAALAAASRVLRTRDPELARECLDTAVRTWDREHDGRAPSLFRSFNTTGGDLQGEEVRAAVELLLATHGGEAYRTRLRELVPAIRKQFGPVGWVASRAIPLMDASFAQELEGALPEYLRGLDAELAKNPFGVPITTANWGGSTAATDLAVRMYFLHRAFPKAVGRDYSFRGLEYVLGRHPASSVSYVSGTGTESRLAAYGSNRADGSFLPGGMIPGIVLVQPDLPDLEPDWPFLWFEGEYVINAATSFILATNAVDALLHEPAQPTP